MTAHHHVLTGDRAASVKPLATYATFAGVAVLLAATALRVGSVSEHRTRTTTTTTTATAPGIVASLGRRPTHNRRYHAEVVSAPALAIGVTQSWTVHLSRWGNRRLANATIVLATRAPENGEASPTTPTARYVGGGDYRVDGIDFPHAGWWNVALVIRGAAGVDSVAFNVILPSTLPRGATPTTGCAVPTTVRRAVAPC